MKRLIIMVMSMAMLVGCADQGPTATQIREGGAETFRQVPMYSADQEEAVLFLDLEKEFKDRKMSLVKIDHPDALTEEYFFDDEGVGVTVLVDGLVSAGHGVVSDIFIVPRNNYMLLSEHPAVKLVASVMEAEQILTWLGGLEGEMTQASKEKENIRETLVANRSYVYFEYAPESDTRRLEFKWAFKHDLPREFEQIASQLEDKGMLTTAVVEGVGTQTLTVTNAKYFELSKMHYRKNAKALGVGEAAAYQVMHDKNKPASYSVQLYGYMRDDLAYPSKVEEMPGMSDIAQLMEMDQETLVSLADEINTALTEAKRVRNKHYKGDYYLEGRVGDYRYIITVPQGILVYKFTVLIEKI